LGDPRYYYYILSSFAVEVEDGYPVGEPGLYPIY
jgi:hypothetical protein